MKTIRLVFHAGLFGAVFVMAVAGLRVAAGAPPFAPGAGIAYAVLGVAHVGALGWLGGKLPPALKPAIAAWLYTAGFVHTLIALGVAIVGTASLAADRSLTIEGVLPILAPMGAAILPHAVAVWIGHSFESRRADALTSVEETLIKRLAEDVTTARGALAGLYAEREQLLKNEIAALKRQISLWDAANTALVTDLEAARRAIAKTLEQLEAPVGRIGDACGGLARDLKQASESASTLQESLSNAGREATGLRPALQETIKTVQDLREVQRSIVELLSSEIFRK